MLTLGSLVWFAIFGTLGINLGETGVLSIETFQEIVATPEVGLFVVIQRYPLGTNYLCCCIGFAVHLF